MAEQILPPDLMAILARAGMLGPGAGPQPQQQPEGSPDLITLAALARAGMLGPEAMGGQAQPMPPTLGGGENMPPSPMPQQGAPPQPQPMPPTLSGAENAAPPGPPQPGLGASMGSFLRGAVNPLGIPAPPPMTVQSPVATLTGREQNLTLPSTIDFNPGANSDPTAEMVGGMVGAVPAVSAVGRAAAPAVRAAASHPTLAGLLAAGGLTATSPAETQDKKKQDAQKAHQQRLVASDPVLQSLQEQIKEQDKIANAPAGQYPKSARDGARARAEKLTTDFNDRLSAASRSSLPFDQAFGPLATAWPAVMALGPGVAASATRNLGNLAEAPRALRWQRAVRQADDAFSSGNNRAFEYYGNRATRFLEDEPGRVRQHTEPFLRDVAMPTLAGTVVGAELAMFPHQYNRRNAPVGSPEREAAETALNQDNIWRTMAPGAVIGTLTGLTGSHVLPSASLLSACRRNPRDTVTANQTAATASSPATTEYSVSARKSQSPGRRHFMASTAPSRRATVRDCTATDTT